MTDKVYSMDELKTILLPLFFQYDVKKAVVFGSYGKACATAKSDVDILVDSGLRGLKFVGMTEAIRESLDKEVDVFDVTHILPQSKIDNEIRSTGVVLYEK